MKWWVDILPPFKSLSRKIMNIVSGGGNRTILTDSKEAAWLMKYSLQIFLLFQRERAQQVLNPSTFYSIPSPDHAIITILSNRCKTESNFLPFKMHTHPSSTSQQPFGKSQQKKKVKNWGSWPTKTFFCKRARPHPSYRKEQNTQDQTLFHLSLTTDPVLSRVTGYFLQRDGEKADKHFQFKACKDKTFLCGKSVLQKAWQEIRLSAESGRDCVK